MQELHRMSSTVRPVATTGRTGGVGALTQRNPQSGAKPQFEATRAIAADVAHAIGVATGYRNALTACGVSLAGQRVLELGPGPSLGAAVCLAAAGATVTAADLYPAQWNPDYHPAFYEALRERLAVAWPGVDTGVVTRLLACERFDASTVELISAGAEGLHLLGAERFTVVLSNAVLEHVADVPRGLQQLARVTAPGGLHLHQIDFRDHRNFARPLEYLTIDNAEFDRVFTSTQGECGNRWRHSQFLRAFACAGFDVSKFEPNVFAPADYQAAIRARLAPEFATLTDEDLRILSGQVVARRLGVGVVPDDLGPRTPRGNVVPFPAPVTRSLAPPDGAGHLTEERPPMLVRELSRIVRFPEAARWIRSKYSRLNPRVEEPAYVDREPASRLVRAASTATTASDGRRRG